MFIQTYSATSPFNPHWEIDKIFAKLLFKSNNLCGSESGRIFVLPLPQKKDLFHRFRFQLPLPLPQPWLKLHVKKAFCYTIPVTRLFIVWLR